MKTILASGMVSAMCWRASGEAKYVGATSPTGPRRCRGKCHLYQSKPRWKCRSKNRVSFEGDGRVAWGSSTLCSQLVPVLGGPTTMNVGFSVSIIGLWVLLQSCISGEGEIGIQRPSVPRGEEGASS